VVAEAGDDEAIIPLNRSRRSLALLAETNRRIGGMTGGDTRIYHISGFDTPAAVEHVLNRLAFQPAASL
jgi:phage gp45-like